MGIRFCKVRPSLHKLKNETHLNLIWKEKRENKGRWAWLSTQRVSGIITAYLILWCQLSRRQIFDMVSGTFLQSSLYRDPPDNAKVYWLTYHKTFHLFTEKSSRDGCPSKYLWLFCLASKGLCRNYHKVGFKYEGTRWQPCQHSATLTLIYPGLLSLYQYIYLGFLMTVSMEANL